MKIFDNFRTWLGERRFWALVGMLVVTGLTSFVLQFVDVENSILSQNALVAAFVLGAILIIGSAMDVQQRGKWSAILLPSFGLVIIGVIIVPQYLPLLMGGAFGWALISLLLFGNERVPMQYRQAIKAMREKNYKKAVEMMDGLIKQQPDVPNHYRFRAELLRLWEKLGRARRDYQTMVDISTSDDDRAVAYNGLAEVDLQSGKYADALVSAQAAYELAPGEWVASYNLGMIADRSGDTDLALEYLTKALNANIPDSRHRLLVHLWRARAFARDGAEAEAKVALDQLKGEKKGLKEWQKILQDEQANVLRQVLEKDVALAERALKDEVQVSDLASG